jgi:hypothetical protein
MENSESEDYLDTIDDSSEESVDSLVNEADSEEEDTEDWDATDNDSDDEDSDDEESEEASDEDEDAIDDDESATPQAPIVSMETLPITGEARVDDALGRLADLQGLPVHEHVAVFEDVQRRLHETLADLAGQ